MPILNAPRFFSKGVLFFLLSGLPTGLAEEATSEKIVVHTLTPQGIPLLTCVEATLAQQPNILIQKEQTVINEGIYETEKGAFDTFLRPSVTHSQQNTPLSALNRATFGAQKQQARVTDAALKLDKQLRNGISAGPQVRVTQNNTSNDLDVATNRAQVNFVINVPLLRDRGREATGAREMAAEKELEASLARDRFTSSQSIFNTLSAYWNYVGAKKSLETLVESEARAKEILDKTNKLVDAGEKPRSDLDQLVANLADKTASRIRAEQSLTEQKQALGFAMGIPFEEIDTLPLPADPFPKPGERPYPALEEKDALIKTAVEKRGDLQEFKLKERSAEILMTSAKNGLLHKLDMNFAAGYAGLEEGTGGSAFVDAFSERVSGFNSTVGVTYELPFANASARGQYLQAKAAFEQRKIQTYDLKRQISSRVATAILALKRNAEELQSSTQAYTLYTKAVKSETEKLRLGMSTFIDVIDMEDRRLTTQLNHISAHQRYVIALAQLRFETGTFFDSEGEKNTLALADLTSIPLRTPVAPKNKE